LLPAILLSGVAVTLILLAALLLATLGIVSYFLGIRNNLIGLRNSLDRSYFDMDILLKQRHDEIPKLLATCKGYMQREQKTLQAVTEARATYARAATQEEKAQADSINTGTLHTLFAVAGKYPELKANSNFIQLRGRIAALEERIAAQRDRYNQEVNAFNLRLSRVPHNVVARFLRLQPRARLQVTKSDREAPR